MTDRLPATIKSQLKFFHTMPSPESSFLLTEIAIETNAENGRDKTVLGLHVVVESDAMSEHKLHGITACPRDAVLTAGTREKEWQKVSKLTIICDVLTIRTHWWLPECDVFIHARRVEFVGDGCIDTSPPPWDVDKAAASTGTKAGGNGAKGHAAGDIRLFANELGIPAGTQAVKRLITDGGNGQGGGIGQDGAHGTNVTGYLWLTEDYQDEDYYIDSTMKTTVKVRLGQHKNRIVLGIRRIWKVLEITTGSDDIWGVSSQPSDGKPAVAPGDAGDGGAPGGLVSNLAQAEGLWSARPGKAGATAPMARGGNAGTPTSSTFYTCTYYHHIHVNLFGANHDDNSGSAKVEYKHYDTKPGRDFEANPGKDATAVSADIKTVEPNAWVHPRLVPLLRDYVRDCYLAGQRDEAKRLIDAYADIFLGEMPTAHRLWRVRDAAYWHATQAEFAILSQRLDARLDYFGRPAGYTPITSLASAFQLYRMELDIALEVLMFTDWVRARQRGETERAVAAEAASRLVLKETQQLADRIVKAEARLPGLNQKILDLESAQNTVQNKLEVEYTKLHNQATGDLIRIKQIKFVANLAAGLCQVIPYGQPILGGIASLGADATDLLDGEPKEVFAAMKTRLTETVAAYKKTSEETEKLVDKAKKEAKELADADGGKKLKVADIKKLSETKPSTWSTIGKGLPQAGAHLKKAYDTVQLPQSEIDAKIAKLAAENEVWKALSKEIKALIDLRAETYAETLSIGQQVGQAYADIAGNMDSLAALFEKESASRTRQLSGDVYRIIDAMSTRAELALKESLYNVVRAFESALLKRVDVEWSLSTIRQQINELLSDEPIREWTDATVRARIKTLKPMFQKNLREIRAALIEDLRTIILKDRTLDFTIDAEGQPELFADLNRNRDVELDALRLGLIDPDWERQMLSDLSLKRVEFAPGATLPRQGDLEVIVEIGALGIVRSNGELYGIRLAAPIVKSFTYHFDGGAITPAKDSDFTQDLMSLILEGADEKIRQTIAMPAAWTTYTVKASFSRLKGAAKPAIAALHFSAKLACFKAPRKQVVIDLSANDGCTPLLAPGLVEGAFIDAYRIVDSGRRKPVEVGLADPAAKGLVRWEVSEGGDTRHETGKSVRVSAEANTRIEAQFAAAPESIAATVEPA